MKAPAVAIVHYHLRPGGVTSVIRRVSAALARLDIRHVVLTGESRTDAEMPAATVDGLGYGGPPDDPATGVARLKQAAAAALGREPDVWHFHNPSLGKNPRIAAWVDRLAREGAALVLQIHDLAEDNRPANFEVVRHFPHLYPFAPRIGYVFLNSSDRDLFISSGLPEAYLLPNPLPVNEAPPPPPGPPRVLCPVRAIPRKNLAELLLLAAASPPGTRFAVARAPENPDWMPGYEFWKSVAARLDLPVDFEVVDRLLPSGGREASLEAWIGASTHFVSTSVAEGFGMAFIEAAAWGRPLIGRDLPRVTRDFAAGGLCVGRLYQRLLVDGRDFAGLSADDQAGWIARVSEGSPEGEVVSGGVATPLREWLEEALAAREPTVRPHQLGEFSADSVAARLLDIYRSLAAGARQTPRHLAPAAIAELVAQRNAGERASFTAPGAAS